METRTRASQAPQPGNNCLEPELLSTLAERAASTEEATDSESASLLEVQINKLTDLYRTCLTEKLPNTA